MCGIFGLIVRHDSNFRLDATRSVLDQLLIRSETRGKDACGVALVDDTGIDVLKRPIRAKDAVRTTDYQQLVASFVQRAHAPLMVMGHARMVTNGDSACHSNNQPVIKHEMVCLHNGIIVNDAALWQTRSGMERQFEVDTEVFLSLIQQQREQGADLPKAFAAAFSQLEGANTMALVAAKANALLLATSNGSLYVAHSRNQSEFIFGSEAYILRQVMRHPAVAGLFEGSSIRQVKPGEAFAISFDDLALKPLSLETPQTNAVRLAPAPEQRTIRDHDKYEAAFKRPKVASGFSNVYGANDAFVQRVHDAVAHLRRCSRCLLPESFPFIRFDADGVCNYCHNYKPYPFRGHDALDKLVTPFRSKNGTQDCLVPVSGGRDSSYGLHYIKNVLGMNPVAYTYDWGLVTDLARRNISRMCGKLAVEHILISANIRHKRENVRKNVEAWLRKPELGTVPLFMAGDKQFFYYANMLKQEMNLGLVLFSMNPLERTDFKVGFTGIDETNRKQDKHYALSLADRAQMLGYYGRQFVTNPAYLNSSLLDSFGAFISYYMIKKDYETLYEYLRWDESEIERTLIDEYDWETATDTDSTWRIGDGTAAFYNYIYYVMAGFSENDTFHSNQIREGMITREEGLRRIEQNNQPRYETIRWYAHIIGFDFEQAIAAINRAPKRYPFD